MKSEKKNGKTSFSVKDRFEYWFDNRVTKGSLALIRALIAASVVLAVLIAGLIILFGFNEEGETASVFWNSIATIINAWMPSYEDGSLGYLILMSVTAIAGLLFMSVLIGIITSAIEEKIDSLKKGNSIVLEEGHTVVLGFYPGEYNLLRQLILAAADEPACVVIVEDMEREEMEQDISENLDVPKNFRIVCRTADITDPASIEKCSLESCKAVVISPTNCLRTSKAILAASALLEEKGASDVRINAIIAKADYYFPASLMRANNVSVLQTNTIIAEIIAHSCTQTGLAETFREVFDFDGCEFYLDSIPGIDGLTFAQLTARLDKAVPVGVLRDGKTVMNPGADFAFARTDMVLTFRGDEVPSLLDAAPDAVRGSVDASGRAVEGETAETVIIGHNEALPIILRELPESVTGVRLAGQDTAAEEKAALERVAAERGLRLTYHDGDPHAEAVLGDLAGTAGHVVILNDHAKDPESADMEAIFMLLNLRDIRERNGYGYNITVELRKENNHKLVGRGDHTDFLVSSSMSSMILAQLAESPELIEVFREILSNSGNELYLKNVGSLKLEGTHTVRGLRGIMLQCGYVLLGCLDAEKNSRYNLPLGETVTLEKEDNLIVLGRN